MLFRRHPQAREWLYRRHYWLPTHPKVLYALVGLALAPVVPLAIVLVVPWLRFRTKTWRAPGRLRQVYPALPGTFLLDVAETFALVRGSIRYRTLVI
jgi:hypothetical protein